MEGEKAIIALSMNTPGIRRINRIFVLTAFSVAMGFLEAVVVVYLRQLYYPEGFSFPLKPMAVEAFSLEMLRELSTIVMLVCLGIVAGRNSSERLAWVFYCFGIWDIFYYVWLKVLLNWPLSLMTWDILFLIPIVWSGPVLAPVVCSITMVIIAAVILTCQRGGQGAAMNMTDWMLLSVGALTIVSAFVWDYTKLIIQGSFLPRLPLLGRDPLFREAVARHVPEAFNWSLFLLGEGLIVVFGVLFRGRTKRSAGHFI